MLKEIFVIVDDPDGKSIVSKTFDWFLIILILLNITSVIIFSFNNIPEDILSALTIFEIISVVIFTVEYLLRLITSKYKFPKKRHPQIHYIFSFMAIIDLVAILPFYLPLLFPFDLRFVRILRLFRLFRIFKLNRYNDATSIIIGVLKNEKEKLLTTIFVMAILLIFSASLMYYVENSVQPEIFPNIIESIWWAVATLTTVGYGDVYPITGLGKILSGVIAILGIGLVALPTGIISSGFISEVGKKSAKKICPHCGKEING